MDNKVKLNVYQKLAQVRKTAEVIQKNADGYGYKYVTEDEILAKISGVMDKYGVSLIPEIVPGTFQVEPYCYVETKRTNKGESYDVTKNELIVKSDMRFRWVNNDNPDECIIIPWAMTGHQSDGSQAMGTALTYAYRYFLLKFFGIATPQDDPDNWRSKQKEAEKSESKTIAEGIIDTFDTELRKYLSDHPDSNGEVKTFISRFAKAGNYRLITEPTLAAKLLADFRDKYLTTEE